MNPSTGGGAPDSRRAITTSAIRPIVYANAYQRPQRTTFSIVAVFLPVGLMPGVSGQYFKQFGLTVVVAVLMSLAVARLITPMIAAYFLKAHGKASHGEGRGMDLYMRVLHWSLDRTKADRWRATRSKRRWFGWVVDHRYWMMGIGALSFLLTIVAYGTLSKK